MNHRIFRLFVVLTPFVLAHLSFPYPVFAVEPAVLDAEAQRVAVMASVAPTVVSIFGSSGDGGGSGVLISNDGYALSNFHVTSGSGDFMKCGLNDGVLYDAVIVGIDPTGDVAMLKLLGRDDFPAATLGDSDAVRLGEYVFAMGNPFLLATDFHPTVTYGIVSGIHRYQYPAGTFLEYTDCIQVDASINPGNSGGPLFNADGRLIGINGRGSFEKRGRVNIGAGYAISINQIRNFMDHLKSGRVVDHGALGATVISRDDGAVVVDRIVEDCEVWRRGIRPGHEIISLAGRSIRSANQFKNVLGIFPKGWKVPIVYRSDEGSPAQVLVRLHGLHRDSELSPERAAPKSIPIPHGPDGPQEPKPDEAKSQIPEQYAHLLVKRPGYANYYFNQQHQTRFREYLLSFGEFPAGTTWIINGTGPAKQPCEIVLGDSGLGLSVASDDYYQPVGDFSLQNEPPGSNGLLVSLHHLRQLLVNAEAGFAEFYYIGSEPLDGTGERVDVYDTANGTQVSRWYVGRDSARLIGFDTQLTEDVDACEIRFRSFKQFDNHVLPNVFTVQQGGNEYGTFHIDTVEFKSRSTDPTP